MVRRRLWAPMPMVSRLATSARPKMPALRPRRRRAPESAHRAAGRALAVPGLSLVGRPRGVGPVGAGAQLGRVRAMRPVVLESMNLNACERALVVAALEEAGSIVEAAQLLGVRPRAVQRLIVKHRIEWPKAAQA
jgi:transcriptional regulator with GAF, ATPase, and Fis domain